MSESSIEPPEVAAEDVLQVRDDRFGTDTTCVVTGAASGIGRATALALAANGLTVVATDVDEEGLEGTVDRAADIGAAGTVEPVPANLLDDDAAAAVIEAAAERGDLRYVANVAGMQHVAPIEAFPMDVYDRMHRVMLRAPLLLSKHALPHVREAGGGATWPRSTATTSRATRSPTTS
jgi:3-hydroxybutyrate dehydrogenase